MYEVKKKKNNESVRIKLWENTCIQEWLHSPLKEYGNQNKCLTCGESKWKKNIKKS